MAYGIHTRGYYIYVTTKISRLQQLPSLGIYGRKLKPVCASYLDSIHPIYARQWAHKADTFSDKHSLFRAAALATTSLSLSTVLLQVVFGLPLALRPSGVHPNAGKQSFSASLLSTCPNQFHLLLRRTSQLISLISAISTTLLFVILCCHLIFMIRLRHWY